MKNIALVVAACAALVSLAGDPLGELMGVDLSKPWPNTGDALKIPSAIGPFSSGYVYTNATTGVVHQFNLRADCAAGASVDEAKVVMLGVEGAIIERFPGIEDFKPRLGRPEYLYGRCATLPGGKGWNVALYVAPPSREGGALQLMLTFWNPSLDVCK